MRTPSAVFATLVLAQSVVQAQPILSAAASAPRFKVLALAESGGHHVEFTKAAKPWLTKCGGENGFEVDYITNTASITEAFLAKYRLVLQLDFVPYGWTPEAMAAFKGWIEEGRRRSANARRPPFSGGLSSLPLPERCAE
jgi:hypothetical protein